MRLSSTVQTVLHLLGSLILFHGILLLLPLVPVVLYREYALIWVFLAPCLASSVIGYLLRKFSKPGTVRYLQAMLICGMAWLLLSLFGCIPFFLGAKLSFLDAYFETVSGFTTTGMTVFTNIEMLPRSIIFWRSIIQWFGGLGILTFFLAITFGSNVAHFQLFSAESHKIDSPRPTPSIFKTVVILWGLYVFLTLCELVILKLLGVGLFDAVCHSLTTLSTGGFCSHDASIDHFRREGFAHYKAIEYVFIFFMLLGGINFIVHFKVLSGRLRDAANDTELRWFIIIILCSTTFVLLDHYRHYTGFSVDGLERAFRNTIFTVVSLVTTTGYGTTDISDPFFPAMSKQVFLILMLIGGCVGSTAGGIKVLRITVLYKAFKKQISRLMLPDKALSEVVINHKMLPDAELKRIAGLFFGWLFLILIGGLVTAFFTNMGSFEAFSGMFSAVGNIGPSYISVQQLSELPAIVKLTYVFGMLAGRLEILPILLMFNVRAWK